MLDEGVLFRESFKCAVTIDFVEIHKRRSTNLLRISTAPKKIPSKNESL